MGVRQKEAGVNRRAGVGEYTVDWVELRTLYPVEVTELLNLLKQ